MNDKWLYYGVFFDENAKKFLERKARKILEIPEGWRLYFDHMTIVFNDGSEEKQEIANSLEEVLGNQEKLIINKVGLSDDAIAFGISNYKTQNKQSHITIAVAPGSKPVQSNDIKMWMPIEEFYVKGTIKKVMKR